MYIQVPDVRGYLGKEGDRIVFGAMSVFKCEGSPHTDRLWGLIPKRLLPTFDCWLSCTWLPRWLSDEESTCQGKRLRRHGFDPGLEKSSGVGNGNPSSILARKSHEQRSWQATECVVAKSRTRLTDWARKHTLLHLALKSAELQTHSVASLELKLG